ncbi:hypothetical protein [Hyphomicrobium zavarzinii]|jgi:hypothetical protein|uniref:hypothetical protein n=1 Tax=Hyphomicrobium zavarzinii TaxID=48292 RepID=UPI002354D50B|nr:hypothetical protein [Hyphomicrobium zavarzinii]HML44627.1 hypothetical protein [Hyphomicrobium zavarzinii]
MTRCSKLGVLDLGVVRGLTAAAGLCVLAGAAAAEDVPKNLVCSFTSGASWSYDAGVFHSKPPSPLSFSIEEIDLEQQKATLQTENGSTGGKLSVVRAINANHFIEIVNEGFMNLTTIYDKDAASGKHPAVHSRHFGILGQPVFSQYTGFCSDK